MDIGGVKKCARMIGAKSAMIAIIITKVSSMSPSIATAGQNRANPTSKFSSPSAE